MAGYLQDDITPEELERQKSLYEPFTGAVRDLVDATMRTLVDDDEIRRAQAEIEEITARGRALANGPAVVVTMGEADALVLHGGEATHVPAPRVDAIDTTGAGDAFCGSLAAGIADGLGLVDAARRAVRVGSLSTKRRGALESFPSAGEILESLAA